MDRGFEKLMHQIGEWEENNIKVIDKSIFNWFEAYGLSVIKSFCDDGETKLEYKINEDCISVDITSKILMLTEMKSDSEMWRVLQIASTVSIEANEDQTVTMNLWFRGWNWIEK